ncbi:CobW family GTP-binding protein [Ktedonobacter robiniae]|uniref:GTP-binding protein n=1 Tax=Ktedonobacter robiniae TaxID=2778365 RepID=A0ABQ3V893_9CHLR|nr:GTP-binding protein [Ktedonobacter robiniae]GHO60762.1 GTP-binding protein [Ktedonobacter robiniae]
MSMLAHKRTDQRIPVYVLVGFLGSGKTTVLGEMLGWCVEQGLKPGLIINEFGDVSIDGEALRDEGLAMTELTDGCVCCTAGEELVPAILEMARRPDVDLVFLEATGLADPADMLDELTAPFLWQKVVVGGIISVMDSKRIIELAGNLELARKQIEFADVLVMNKCDLIDPEWRQALLEWVPRYAPKAQVFPAVEGLPEEGVEALLLHALHLGEKRLEHIPAPQHQEEHERTHDAHEHHHEHEHEHDAHEHHHEHGHAHESLHTVGLPLDQPVERARFEHFLRELPEEIYRAKGFVTFVDDPQAIHVFQFTPGFLRIRPFKLQRRDLLRAVFIGQNLEKAGLAEQLQTCTQPATPEQTKIPSN